MTTELALPDLATEINREHELAEAYARTAAEVGNG